MATRVAETAVVHPRAQLESDVEIGPYCVIGPDATIGRGTKLENHVTLMGRVGIGRDNHVFPGTVIGAPPQDFSYQDEPTEVVIGDANVIRESVTINRGTAKGDGITRLGDNCYLMAACHVAHDCRLGDRVVLANATLLGGHVHVNHDATVSGGVAVHHYTTIGSYCFVGGLSRVIRDVPPFMLVEGSPARPRCVNVVALKRHEFPPDTIRSLTEAYRLLFRSKVGLDHAREILRVGGPLAPAVNHLLSFVQNQHEGRHGRGRERRSAA